MRARGALLAASGRHRAPRRAASTSGLGDGLDVDDQTDRAVTEVLVDFLRDCRLLVVPDNCEHALDACADLVGVLLREAEGCG